jgi:hypothetical protein
MSAPVDPKAFLTLVESAIANMYEFVEAIGELLEQKGLFTKQEILDLTKDLKLKNPPTDPIDPSQESCTAQENAVIEQIMAVILQHGLSADHAKTLLGQTIQLLERGKQSVHEPPQANA